MIRRAIKAVSALLLLLCVVAYGQSYSHKSYLTRSGSGGIYQLTISRGRLAINWDAEPFGAYGNDWDCGTFAPAFPINLPPASSWDPNDRLYFDRFGFGFATHQFAASGRQDHTLAIPMWFPSVMLAVPVALTVMKALRLRRRLKLRLCLTCGYDLRASTDCCPECGTAIPHQSEIVPTRV